MPNEKFKEDLKELKSLWDIYQSIPKKFGQSKQWLARYNKKLDEISGNYHMDKEDIVLNMNTI